MSDDALRETLAVKCATIDDHEQAFVIVSCSCAISSRHNMINSVVVYFVLTNHVRSHVHFSPRNILISIIFSSGLHGNIFWTRQCLESNWKIGQYNAANTIAVYSSISAAAVSLRLFTHWNSPLVCPIPRSVKDL
ncbi:hypothetical protein EMEDMD4_580014 [Sinorhizobium medicae]|uniref:Uncharacterized protein n=1 Tax=Sinorhizobium medicae TaxID=110321 RepID=A0A508X8I1_9HYPH|nr:hypothetical protein EMEDMD4_580014 [Sinorhizobium medicae]